MAQWHVTCQYFGNKSSGGLLWKLEINQQWQKKNETIKNVKSLIDYRKNYTSHGQTWKWSPEVSDWQHVKQFKVNLPIIEMFFLLQKDRKSAWVCGKLQTEAIPRHITKNTLEMWCSVSIVVKIRNRLSSYSINRNRCSQCPKSCNLDTISEPYEQRLP